MAEKEERIVCRVIEKGYGCDYCFSRPAHKYYQCSISNNDCTYDMCKQCSLGMSRQEAIEKMAKAICLERHACISKGEMCGLCELWRNFSTHAEAALNALLEAEK